jgi:hypothetical protein
MGFEENIRENKQAIKKSLLGEGYGGIVKWQGGVSTPCIEVVGVITRRRNPYLPLPRGRNHKGHFFIIKRRQ